MSGKVELNSKMMLEALSHLDALLEKAVTLFVGGGGAMILAHKFLRATTDIDAFPKGISVEELGDLVKIVAKDHNLSPDWLNPYFSTYAHVLPNDYQVRLIEVFAGKNLRALCLGKEDLMIMKCFAHRQKDVMHTKELIRQGADLKIVEKRLDELKKKSIPGVQQAMDFLDDIMDHI